MGKKTRKLKSPQIKSPQPKSPPSKSPLPITTAPTSSGSPPSDTPSGNFWKPALAVLLSCGAIVVFVWLMQPPAGNRPPDDRNGNGSPLEKSGLPHNSPANGRDNLASLLAKQRTSRSRTWPTWAPTTEDDNKVDAFIRQRGDNSTGGTALLAPDPRFDENTPVTQKEADAMHAGFFLHRCAKVIKVRSGEPDSESGWLTTPNRYTLAVQVTGVTPQLRIKSGEKVDFPSRLSIVDPDIVVEIRDGKIFALRAELHRD